MGLEGGENPEPQRTIFRNTICALQRRIFLHGMDHLWCLEGNRGGSKQQVVIPTGIKLIIVFLVSKHVLALFAKHRWALLECLQVYWFKQFSAFVDVLQVMCTIRSRLIYLFCSYGSHLRDCQGSHDNVAQMDVGFIAEALVELTN